MKSIHSPFYFELETLHLCFCDDICIDNIPNVFRCTNEYEIAISKGKTSKSENSMVWYNEMIIKVKVDYKGSFYYYPIIAFVDNDFSLFRGIYLGFDKVMGKIVHTGCSYKLKSLKGLELFRTELRDCTKIEKAPQQMPFILYRDLSMFDEIVPSICKLKSHMLEYTVGKKVYKGKIHGDLIGQLFGKMEIEADTFKSNEKFLITGVQRID